MSINISKSPSDQGKNFNEKSPFDEENKAGYNAYESSFGEDISRLYKSGKRALLSKFGTKEE
jgi:hypothetical protein